MRERINDPEYVAVDKSRLYQILYRRGTTVHELSQTVGKSRSYISARLCVNGGLPKSIIPQICAALDVSPAQFIVPEYSPVDRVKLKRMLSMSGETLLTASARLGYSQSYLNSMLTRHNEQLRSDVLEQLDALFGIKIKDIAVGVGAVEESAPEPVQQELVLETRRDSALSEDDWSRLYRLMVEAFKEALNG